MNERIRGEMERTLMILDEHIITVSRLRHYHDGSARKGMEELLVFLTKQEERYKKLLNSNMMEGN